MTRSKTISRPSTLRGWTEALLAAVLAASPAFAQEPSAEVEASTAAVESSTSAVEAASSTETASAPVALSTATPTVEEVVSAIKAMDAGLESLQADFEQRVRTQIGLSQSQTGRLFYRKPDRIRMEYEKPRKQTIFSDRTTLWIHQEDDKQVIRAQWEDWKKNQPQLTGLLEFGQYTNLLDRHDVSLAAYDAPASSPTWKLVLKPKGGEGTYVLEFFVSRPDFFPHTTSLTIGALTIVSELKDIELNPKLKGSIFEFRPPPNLPVIDLKAPPLTP